VKDISFGVLKSIGLGILRAVRKENLKHTIMKTEKEIKDKIKESKESRLKLNDSFKIVTDASDYQYNYDIQNQINILDHSIWLLEWVLN
jgi:hypothetical protein